MLLKYNYKKIALYLHPSIKLHKQDHLIRPLII